jgi:hypothetical protein
MYVGGGLQGGVELGPQLCGDTAMSSSGVVWRTSNQKYYRSTDFSVHNYKKGRGEGESLEPGAL